MRATLLLVLALAGCAWPAQIAGDCGEVQRISDGAWFLPTAQASSAPFPAGMRVESALQAAWDNSYRTHPCGVAVAEGAPAPWYGPMLRPGERDALTVVLYDRTWEQNVVRQGGEWTVRIEVDADAVRVMPESWTGEVEGDVLAAFLVEGVQEGVATLNIQLDAPYEGIPAQHALKYVVNATAGAPHRV